MRNLLAEHAIDEHRGGFDLSHGKRPSCARRLNLCHHTCYCKHTVWRIATAVEQFIETIWIVRTDICTAIALAHLAGLEGRSS
jgi:hypothetical protein